MDSSKVTALKDEILALPEGEREELAREVLPTLLLTPAGLAEIDEALSREPLRLYRRLHSLRGWGHGETKQVFPRGA